MFKHFLYFFIFSILCQTALAQNHPLVTNIVYRVDTRDPLEIERQRGFHTWAETTNNYPNNNLASHIEGGSLGESHGGDRTSNFVSTSSSLSAAVEFGLQNLLTFGVQESFYIYRIRPNHNFYDVNASLRNARDSNSSTPERSDLLNDLLDIYATEEKEIIALGSISDERIVQYAEFSLEMYNEFRSAVFQPDFWEDRWVNYFSYNHQYDQDQSNPDFYPEVEPNGFMQVVLNEENGNQAPLSQSCIGSPSAM